MSPGGSRLKVAKDQGDSRVQGDAHTWQPAVFPGLLVQETSWDFWQDVKGGGLGGPLHQVNKYSSKERATSITQARAKFTERRESIAKSDTGLLSTVCRQEMMMPFQLILKHW
jgi:hypothetical protein